MRRADKLRAYPTCPQEGRALRLLADHCDLDNAALAERREAWRMRNLSVAYGDQSAQLKEIRVADPDGQGRHSFTAQQQTLRRLNGAFAGYFRRVRDAKGSARRVGYPNRRRDFHHKTARRLVDSCDTLALEDLRVAAMTASAAGTGARNIAARAGLGSGQASAA